MAPSLKMYMIELHVFFLKRLESPGPADLASGYSYLVVFLTCIREVEAQQGIRQSISRRRSKVEGIPRHVGVAGVLRQGNSVRFLAVFSQHTRCFWTLSSLHGGLYML